MSTSLAAVFSGTPGQLELREMSTPQPASGEILVRVLGCTLCGSDLHTFEGRRQGPVPTILGHEIVGQIEAFGSDQPRHDMVGHRLEPGDRVSWSLVASCGACFFCLRGLPQKCVNAVKYGHERFQPGRELLGGLAEHCLIVPGTSILRLPDSLSLEVACSANCATATAAAAIEAAGELKGACVCVLGAGLLGLTIAAMAKTCGAAEVMCVEVHPQRREAATLFGATRSISPDELADKALQVTGGRGVDVAFEACGSPAGFTSVWPQVRTGGTIIVVGAVFPSPPVDLPLEQLVRRHLVLRGIHNYSPRHLLQGMNFLEAHARDFPFAGTVAEWHPLARVQAAFQSAGDRDKVRVGVRLDSGSGT